MNVGDWEESMSRHHQKIKLVNAINIFTTYSFIFNAEIKADFYRKKTVVSKWLIFNMRFNAHHHPSAHLWRQDVTPQRICDAKMWRMTFPVGFLGIFSTILSHPICSRLSKIEFAKSKISFSVFWNCVSSLK